MVYKLELNTERESKAKLCFIDLDEIIAQENYEVKFTLKNVGDKTFPGGVFQIKIRYECDLGHTVVRKIPEIKVGEKKSLDPIEKKALAKGYG